MAWLTKREIAYYLVLRYIFRDHVFNLGEAFDVLMLLGPKSTARKILKRLVSRGLVEKADDLNYMFSDTLEKCLLNNLRSYIVQRIYRRLKSSGINTAIVTENGKEKIIVYNCGSLLKARLDLLKNIIDVECR